MGTRTGTGTRGGEDVCVCVCWERSVRNVTPYYTSPLSAPLSAEEKIGEERKREERVGKEGMEGMEGMDRIGQDRTGRGMSPARA